MKFLKFNFKNESVWMLIFGVLPLIAAILTTLVLFALRGFDL